MSEPGQGDAALIPLDDPIWDRLWGYGPNPTPQLAALSEHYDADAAKELFYEGLHHQGTLYPKTYASLPWIWETFPRDDRETHYFLSHVVAMALSTVPTEFERYQGLSLNLADQPRYLPEESRLRPEDLPVLMRLQTWMDEHLTALAEAPLVGIQQENAQDAFHLMEGYLALGDPRIEQEWPRRQLASVAEFITGYLRELPDAPGEFEIPAEYGGEPTREEIIGELDLETPEAQEWFRVQIERVKPLNRALYDLLASVLDEPGQ